MNTVSCFAVSQLSSNQEPRMLTVYPLTRYGWLEMITFLSLRGGKQVAEKSGLYLMIDISRVQGKWQRAYIKYNARLDYVDVQRIVELYCSVRGRISGYEHDPEATDKALWSLVDRKICLSFGPATFCDDGPGFTARESHGAWLTDIMLSLEFPLSDNDGVLPVVYPQVNP